MKANIILSRTKIKIIRWKLKIKISYFDYCICKVINQDPEFLDETYSVDPTQRNPNLTNQYVYA